MLTPYLARKRHSAGILLLALIAGLALFGNQAVMAQTETMLYAFIGGPDGAWPYADVTRDAKGNLYGTTYLGGTSDYGVAFELTASGVEKQLHAFIGGTDGISPYGNLVMGKKGVLYGVTLGGGLGYGTVFGVTATGKVTMVFGFDGLHGAYPAMGLIRDTAGNLYGATPGGGPYSSGVVFSLTPGGTQTVLYNFTGGADGDCPSSILVRDKNGNLYGTTSWGGDYNNGTIFELTTEGTEHVLCSFTGGIDGAYPGSLIRDGKGNLYGTTQSGGRYTYGTVFELTSTGSFKTLYSFTGGADENMPHGTLSRDAKGNLYATTYMGGAYNYGTVFQLTKKNVESVLYNFTGGADGRYPWSGVTRDSKGNLYGTTVAGGVQNCATYGDGGGCGTVFMVTP